jgi:hypothetical protein
MDDDNVDKLHEVIKRLINEQRATRREQDRIRLMLSGSPNAESLSLYGAVCFYVKSYKDFTAAKFQLVTRIKRVRSSAKRLGDSKLRAEVEALLVWVEDSF